MTTTQFGELVSRAPSPPARYVVEMIASIPNQVVDAAKKSLRAFLSEPHENLDQRRDLRCDKDRYSTLAHPVVWSAPCLVCWLGMFQTFTLREEPDILTEPGLVSATPTTTHVLTQPSFAVEQNR